MENLAVSEEGDAGTAGPALGERLRKHRWFLLLVVVPVILASLYYAFVASDVFVSESRFVIRSPGNQTSRSFSISNLFDGKTNASAPEETNQAIAYLRSRDALRSLGGDIDVKAKYDSGKGDFMSSFPGLFRHDSFESFFYYFSKQVPVSVDPETGVVVLQVQAFDPGDAHDINAHLLAQAEKRVNTLNANAQKEAIRENEARLEGAMQRLADARVALSGYRNRSQLLDPQEQASGVMQVSNGLVAERASLQAQIDSIRKQAPDHPSLPAMQAQLRALNTQIAMEEGKAVGTPSGIASKMSEYERLLADQEFASQMVTAASTSLEQARTEIERKQFYLERIAEPNTPDQAQLPHRIRSILTIAGVVLCLYFIGWMLIVGILEHSPDE